MLDTTTALRTADGAFVIAANGTLKAFSINDHTFAAWIADKGDELARHLPTLGDACPGSTLANLVYQALSAHVLIGDPGIELNIHGLAEGAGYFVRLNNRAGRQNSVGLTRGWHELHRPPNDLTPGDRARHYLLQVCCIANSLLADLLPPE